jgi:hypothetical protein
MATKCGVACVAAAVWGGLAGGKIKAGERTGGKKRG